MRSFVQKPKGYQPVRSPAAAGWDRGRDGHVPEGRRVIASSPDAPAGAGYDFSSLPVTPTRKAPDPASSDARRGIRSAVRQISHQFSAAVRRVGSGFQNDSPGTGGRSPAAAQAAINPPASPMPELEEGETIQLPPGVLGFFSLPEQRDRISSTFEYQQSIDPVSPPSAPGQFGKTDYVFQEGTPALSVTHQRGTYTVAGAILARLTYWVAGTNRTDIASDADPDITQQNYPTIASDLTPSPTTITRGNQTLYKGQPPRTLFWAEDLTTKHELFHVDEDLKFGREGMGLAQTWLNSQTAANDNELIRLLGRFVPMIGSHVAGKTALPQVELRAYDHGATEYRDRAQAIRRKGDAKQYPLRAPARQTPNSPPAPTRNPQPSR